MASVVYAENDDLDDELAGALIRFLATQGCPLYLRSAARAWLTQR